MRIRKSLTRAIVQSSLLTIASLIFCCLAIEVVFRIFGIGIYVYLRPDPLLGYSFIPGAAYKFDSEGYSHGTINSQGRRDYEYTYEKPKNTCRILIIGDSFTEAFQVALDSTFHKILERRLNAKKRKYTFEVIAFGRGGMGTLEEMLWYRKEAFRYHPDIVV